MEEARRRAAAPGAIRRAAVDHEPMLSEHADTATTRLLTATRTIARALALDDVLRATCRSARAIVGADGATFVLREGEQVHYAAEDAIAPLWVGKRFPMTCCISGWSILRRTTAVVEDIYADDRIPIEAYRPTFVKSLAMVPLRKADPMTPLDLPDPLAAMGVYWATRHRASAAELALLEALADTASMALVNALLYEQMRCAREEAEDANRTKDEFLMVLSHELRTPLSTIGTWSSLLKRKVLDAAKVARAVEAIDRSAREQARLVEDLLDISRVIAGRLAIEVTDVDLKALVEGALEAARAAAEAKGLSLTLRAEPGAIGTRGDPVRLRQILGNLLANAVKFTPPGGQVSVSIERSDGIATITVTDTGEGMAADFLPHVFEPFRQADSSPTRRHGGLGLGLAIARRLVELHGGTLTADSAGPGEGARFTIGLPLRAAAAGTDVPKNGGTAPMRLDGVRVLLVDDDAEALEAIRTALVAAGASVRGVTSAGEAIAAWSVEDLDVLVSDIGMPDADGCELLAALHDGADPPPAIALTGYATAADRERVLGAGYRRHLAKPVDPAELIAAVAQLARD